MSQQRDTVLSPRASEPSVKKTLLALLPLVFACQADPGPVLSEPVPAADPHAGHDHAAPAAAGQAGHAEMVHGHSFADAQKWAAVFDAADRDTWQMPVELVAALAIEPGMTVVDLGAGTGYFEAHLAGAVGAEGKVIAIDSEPDMVSYMQARLEREPLPQVELRRADPGDSTLGTAEADLVLLVNTYHHITERPAYFAKLCAAMKPGGRLAVVDYTPGDSPHGPPAAMRITPQAVQTELEGSGWTRVGSLDLLPEQYVLLIAAAPTAAASAAGE